MSFQDRDDRQHDPARVLALSDGVFAIVITLLVLEIHVPDLAGGESLKQALQEVRPSRVGFLISFVFVAIAWAGHRDLFALVKRTDPALVWLNILYLLPVCLLPFGAALISRYEQEPVALNMYGFLLLFIALTRLVAWLYQRTDRISCSSPSTDGQGMRGCLSWRCHQRSTCLRSACPRERRSQA